MEGVVWCDGGLSLMDEGWSSVVGVAGWVLLSMGGHLWVGSGHLQVGAVTHGWVAIICNGRLLFVGVGSSFVVGDCSLWMGGSHLWWGVIVYGWGGGPLWSSACGASLSLGGGCCPCVGCCCPWGGHCCP